MATCVTTTTLPPSEPTQTSLLDDEMTALALQLEEVDLIEQAGKGKYPAESPPDGQLACDSFQREITAHLEFLRDLKLAHSMALAIDSDAQAIADLIGPEQQAGEDRRLAELYRQRAEGCEIPEYVLPDIAPFFRSLPELEPSDDEAEAGPSVSYAERQAKAFGKLAQEYECCVCYDTFRLALTARLPCGDRFCNDCLKQLFVRATTDETLFPPRCCRQPIPLGLVRVDLSAEELEAFRNAQVEFSTEDRTYCSSRHCGRFIPETRVQSGRAECGMCGTLTCALCKTAYHQGSDCPADPDLQETLALAHEEGWQRCYSCRSMVELDIGCNHMTCKCGAQFCYVCGLRWKECGCDQWDEPRLLRRAHEVVARDVGPRVLPNIEINRRVAEVQEELRDNHECRHPGWLDRIEAHGRQLECEICTRGFRSFILECPRCHVRICANCKRHRLC